MYYTPSEASSSERDTLLEIEYYLDHTNLQFSPHHVKSHQDDHHPVHQLPAHVQANVKADALVRSSIHEHTNSSYQPPFPNSGCSVNISAYTITRSLPYFLRKLPYDSKIRSHLFHRNSWSPDVTIDWSHFESFSRLIRSYPHFVVKFIHKLLPSGKIAHRNNPNHCDQCPACGLHESNDHTFQCSHITRIPLKRRIVSSSRSYLSTIKTDPILVSIATEGIDACINNRAFPLHLFPPAYHRLCEQQSTIGWLNFLRGLTTPLWSQFELRYRASNDIPAKRLGILSLTLHLIPHLRELWQYRNSQRHNSDLAIHQTELQ